MVQCKSFAALENQHKDLESHRKTCLDQNMVEAVAETETEAEVEVEHCQL